MPANPFPRLAFPTNHRLDVAVQYALEAFFEQVALRFPELTTGDVDPGSHFAFEAAAHEAVETLLRSNNPYCTVDDPDPAVLPDDHFGYIHPDAVALIVALHQAGHPAPYTAVFHPEDQATLPAEGREMRYPAAPQGPGSWLISPAHLRTVMNLAALPNPITGVGDVRLAFSDHSSFTERLREDTAAPNWVSEWVGPFWIEIHDALGQHIDPYVALPDLHAT